MEPPPYVSFNGQVLLTTKMDRKAQSQLPSVLIGPHGKKQFPARDPPSGREGIDRLQIQDPWQNFRSSHTSSRSKPVSESSDASRPSRQEDNGPVAQTLTRQDQRLLQLEQSVQDAVSTQQNQLQDTLLQVKQLFIRGQKRTARSPVASDSPSPREDDDM